jgi:hypothetical protein
MDTERIFGRNKRLRYKGGSFISVPIKIRNNVIGVINVTDKRNLEPFTDNEFMTFSTISDQISKNYENIIYYNEFLEKQRLEKEIEITRDGGGDISGDPGARLRALLYHQGKRAGNGAGPLHHLRDREAARRLDQRLQRTRLGHGL